MDDKKVDKMKSGSEQTLVSKITVQLRNYE